MPESLNEFRPPSLRPGRGAAPSEDQIMAALTASNDLPDEGPEVREMRLNRQANLSAARGGFGLSFATARPRDFEFYWRANNLPFNVWHKDMNGRYQELERLRWVCRMLYLTHPIVGSAVDIYSHYPLIGMEINCKDRMLKEFYEQHFLAEKDEGGLDYQNFLPSVLREYWIAGEAWPMGSWSELLGVWESDELMHPDDIDVIYSPFLKEPRFEMRLPAPLRDILLNRQPLHEYQQIMRTYPELARFTGDNDRLPVSSTLLKFVKHDMDTFHPRGIPIMMRGIRGVLQEEMLNSAQDAVADRLYTPLILAKLGASATDLGTQKPWIPEPGDLTSFEMALDAALAADFRVLVHHFAVDMKPVFGREAMPRFDGDFERLIERILQVFGLSKTMISGAQQGQTYAADALNRDLISQLLTRAQRHAKRVFRARAAVVAEAQEHFDYEERGGKKYRIMEEVLEVDPETGEQKIVEQPKLLIPDLKIRAMNMKDDTEFRQFVEAARASGVPISMQTRFVNVPIDLEEEQDRVKEEQVTLAVKAQEARRETYTALKSDGLPIPADLRADFEPRAQDGTGMTQPGSGMPDQFRLPGLGTEQPADSAAIAPTPGDLADATGLPYADVSGNGAGNVVSLPRNKIRQRPEESDEQRANMPKTQSKAALRLPGFEGMDAEEAGRLAEGPTHIGLRRFVETHREPDPGEPVEEVV